MPSHFMSTILTQCQWRYHIQNWLLPYTCILCDRPTRRNIDLCHACEADLPWLGSYCAQCGMPLLGTQTANHCGQCLRYPPHFDATLVLFDYTDPIRAMISGLKFQNKLIYAKLFSALMLKHIDKSNPVDCLFPVPLHQQRLRERGYNQAVELAKPLAHTLGLPLALDWATRIRATQRQSDIPASERQRNLKNAFALQHAVRDKTIAIIDDVMTTGSTVNELSRLLKRHGAKKVLVWCCARTTKAATYSVRS